MSVSQPPFFPSFLHWVEKQSIRGRAVEALQSFGSKVFMNGPIVRKLCVGGKDQR